MMLKLAIKRIQAGASLRKPGLLGLRHGLAHEEQPLQQFPGAPLLQLAGSDIQAFKL